ncbi:MAG TPA: hypothetical protein VE869_17950, partial [Gemmatimonas sp.]|nr:hypothetical protein [Gemmatimonas sp.]
MLHSAGLKLKTANHANAPSAQPRMQPWGRRADGAHDQHRPFFVEQLAGLEIVRGAPPKKWRPG